METVPAVQDLLIVMVDVVPANDAPFPRAVDVNVVRLGGFLCLGLTGNRPFTVTLALPGFEEQPVPLHALRFVEAMILVAHTFPTAADHGTL